MSDRYSVNTTPELVAQGISFALFLLGAMAGVIAVIAVGQTLFAKETPDRPFAVFLHGALAGFADLHATPDGTMRGSIQPWDSKSSLDVLNFVRDDPTKTLIEHILVVSRDMESVPFEYAYVLVGDDGFVQLIAKLDAENTSDPDVGRTV